MRFLRGRSRSLERGIGMMCVDLISFADFILALARRVLWSLSCFQSSVLYFFPLLDYPVLGLRLTTCTHDPF